MDTDTIVEILGIGLVVAIIWIALASRGVYIIPPFIFFRGQWKMGWWRYFLNH